MERRKFARKGRRRPGKEATQIHGIKATFDRITLPRTPHAEDHSYSLYIASALRYVRRTLYIHSLVTIGPPSSSTLSEKGLGDEATRALAREGLAPRGYLVPTRASSLVKQTDFRLRMGATLEKRSGSVYNLTYVLGATLFLREGGFQATRKTQLARTHTLTIRHK